MRIAVAGASGTAGGAVCEALAGRGHDVVRLGRAQGVDLLTGDGLDAALDGCTAVIDASAVTPPDERTSPREAIVTAARTLAGACSRAGVRRLVVLSIINVDDPGFDGFDYYVAKREQERAAREAFDGTVVVRSAQWFEFATNPAAVTVQEDRVEAENWLVQPLAVAAVGEVLADTAVAADGGDVTVAGPRPLRLPELTAAYLGAVADPRPVETVDPAVPALGEGALLPGEAEYAGPSLEEWLREPPTLPLD